MAQESALQRAENLYLNILRVFILAVATVALLTVIYGLLSAAPLLGSASSASSRSPSDLRAATLGDFVAEKRAEGAPVGEASASVETQTDTVTSIVAVHDAAAKISAYVEKHLGASLPTGQLIKAIQAYEATIPEAYRVAYETSLLSLSQQLAVARGAPLTADNLDALLQWHAAKFKAAADADVDKEAQAKAGAVLRLQVAGYAMATFLLLVFAFIFVKIERNLRLVHTLARAQP